MPIVLVMAVCALSALCFAAGAPRAMSDALGMARERETLGRTHDRLTPRPRSGD